MRVLAVALGLCGLLAQTQVLAEETASDPLSWLERIAEAGQQLNYVGTFIYQSGSNFETSRIVHIADKNGEREHLEVLDGSPREVIRINNEVRCVLPDQKTVIIDRAGSRRAFPATLPASFADLIENYQVSLGVIRRVAGRKAQQLILAPRDNLRYGHRLWAEVDSGLLMKARMIDETGAIIEQFTFSDVKIGGEIDETPLQADYEKDDQWRVVSAYGEEMPPEASGWILSDALPGYRLKSVIKRPLGRGSGNILHYVYSDGLASISVFIKPLDPTQDKEGMTPFADGPIHIYRRKVDGHMVTALGEVPFTAIKRLGDAIAPATGEAKPESDTVADG